MDEKYICPCGLVCSDCLFYKEGIYEFAVKLRDSIKDSQLDIFLELTVNNENCDRIADHLNAEKEKFKKNFEPFNKFADFLAVLDGLINLQCKSTCRESGGCGVGGQNHSCDALKCVQEKDYKGCWECSENEDCNHLYFVKKAYGETINENFKIMKKFGSERIVSRGNKYYAWQRKRND